ncbi:beta-lactamase regulating signal transducer with metallopeptidase domain [Kordia periserrulae]|uniref:Beta-lactamase regulating signal transducer with metallopeptidase domain n=1 Tax=Kordia periserrulae TaxID=701523 RepID=A0A2T6C657_9FLAO|nr:M56 family metallopeptidase [Kordia periserrulae]PTX63766.1 beta-lactamase regulating signal transducer with metallopeptidase domain [Kordia periserrulae]
MMVYFIKVVAFQLLFLLGYDLFLKKETFFNWNRMYLIFSSLISFVLPFIKIESFQNVVPQEYIILLPEIVLTPQKAVETIEPTWKWFLVIGIAVSSLLFIYKIVQLLKLRFKGRFVKHENYTIVIIPKSSLAFSIFSYVFIGEEIDEAKLEDILSHELVHIQEKHSLDLLYFELLRILCWFNPLVYIYQKRISELHEYIADDRVVQHTNKSNYYEKLLSEVFQTQHFSFTNQFFKHSLIKKRISMLSKQKSREILKLKYLVLVPLLLVSLVYTSCEDSTTEAEDTVEAIEKEAISFQIIDSAPIFPGCENEQTLEDLKSCFTNKIATHVSQHFNAKKASQLGLSGTQKIFVKFVVDKTGAITALDVNSPHPELTAEAERVVEKLPKLSPGMKDGKPVSVKYVLPIAFKVE